VKTANFEVTEVWTVECPECGREMNAPFNEQNPMRPMQVTCANCLEPFLLTYERD
jgi:hypothetical protein